MEEKFNPALYWEERLEKNFDIEGVGYLGLGEAYNNRMYQIRRIIFNRNIRKLKLDFSKQTVLDIGSGTGFYIQLWKEKGVTNLTGADITQIAIKNLSAKYKDVTFIQSDIGEMLDTNLDSKTYSVISIFDVLFHIVEDTRFETAISNIAKLLNNGGYFILSDNFVHHATYRTEHFVNRSLADYKNVLEKNGFEIILRKPVFLFFNVPVDSKNKFLHWFWKIQNKFVYNRKNYGHLLSTLLYPFELFFLSFISEGPSTEIMICRKI